MRRLIKADDQKSQMHKYNLPSEIANYYRKHKKRAIASHKSYIIGIWIHHANEELTYLGYTIYHITPRRLTLI